MKQQFSTNQLIVPVYLNEKIVLDMLAIIEDGFCTVSEVSSLNQNNDSTDYNFGGGLSANTILNKLLKIQIGGSVSNEKRMNKSTKTKAEKIHTNTSLFSKFRSTLIDNELLHSSNNNENNELNLSEMKPGDFIEINGELEKNPMIDIMEKCIKGIRFFNVFEETPVGKKKEINNKKNENNKLLNQLNQFLNELKPSGTIDFILKNQNATFVLSAQERYLSNDNISEIIGGKFSILGKIIKIANENDSINLLRKTTLDILDKYSLDDLIKSFDSEELGKLNLPKPKYEIKSPAAIVIPIAIYI